MDDRQERREKNGEGQWYSWFSDKFTRSKDTLMNVKIQATHQEIFIIYIYILSNGYYQEHIETIYIIYVRRKTQPNRKKNVYLT